MATPLRVVLWNGGDPQIIPPLPPTAGRSSQRPHRRDDYSTHHRPKIEDSGRLNYSALQREINLVSCIAHLRVPTECH